MGKGRNEREETCATWEIVVPESNVTTEDVHDKKKRIVENYLVKEK